MLLIKTAWGNKSLASDFRPPSSGKRNPYNLKAEVRPARPGLYYSLMWKRVRAVLKNLKDQRPQYEFDIVGIGWHQGWKDRKEQSFVDEYEKNLANLIRDMRKALGEENLPFVIAETGMHGPNETGPRALSLMRAQAAVARYEEFQGNVAFVRTMGFQRTKEVSPSDRIYHWNHNAETQFLIGEGMGRAMIQLLNAKPPEK